MIPAFLKATRSKLTNLKGRKLPTFILLLKIILEVLASARGEKKPSVNTGKESKHIIYIYMYIYIFM